MELSESKLSVKFSGISQLSISLSVCLPLFTYQQILQLGLTQLSQSILKILSYKLNLIETQASTWYLIQTDRKQFRESTLTNKFTRAIGITNINK